MATTSKMECKTAIIVLWLLLLGLSDAIEINVTSNWQAELGWQVMCTWRFPDGDRLQSVRLYRNGQQFIIYRPEKHGPYHSEFFNAQENLMKVTCMEKLEESDKGQCELLVEPHQPSVDFSVMCEVSGEAPSFMMNTKDYFVQAIVPPSDAELVVSTQKQHMPTRTTLNCSSAGLPPPKLLWTVAKQQLNTKADFTGRVWNSTSKLWHVWSFVSLTPPTELPVEVTCTPVGPKDRGQTAAYTVRNTADRLYFGSSVLACLVVLFWSGTCV